MSRLYFFIICCLISSSTLGQDVLAITPGSSLHIGPAGMLTLHNTSLNNNGGISTAAGSAIIRFTGNITTSIQGTNPPLFDIIQIEKTEGAELQLQRNINVRDQVGERNKFLRMK